MRKRAKYLTIAATLSLAAMMAMGAYATDNHWETYEEDFGRQTKYSYMIYDENGTPDYYRSCWQWIDGNNDGTAECYYFGSDAYLLVSTTTPDGYTVNADGQWTVNGVVQTKGVEIDTTRTDYKMQQQVNQMKADGVSWPIVVTNGSSEHSEYYKNADFVALMESQFVLDNGGYNEYGISNAAVDLITHSREENKKYGELFVVEGVGYANATRVTYKNGMEVFYPISTETRKADGAAYVGRADDWCSSLKNNKTYLFKYCPTTKWNVETYSDDLYAWKQKLRNLGFPDSNIGYSGVLYTNIQINQELVYNDNRPHYVAADTEGTIRGCTKVTFK